ncbi:MAG TPA: CHAD domain-containing protein [Thermoplasmata archaeon]|jgi:CHAD domain-containing protein|nr:CHAD domain-containing protein [Thermoplasmata archaeon]
MVARRTSGASGLRTLAAQVRQLLAEVTAQIDDVIGRPHPSPESLHELHRSMRRLRHALALWTRVLRPPDRAISKPLDRRLARLARLIGRVRDRDVMLALLEDGDLPRPRGPDVAAVARLRARWRDDARTGREVLRVFLRSERDAHLFEQIGAAITLTPRTDRPIRLAELLDEEAQARAERVRGAQKKARRKGSVARLHRLRIQVRRLRHLNELRSRLEPDRAATPPPVVRRLQSQLGHLHDLDLVLEGVGPALTATAWGEALRAQRRRLRRAIATTIRERRWPWRATSPSGSGARPS